MALDKHAEKKAEYGAFTKGTTLGLKHSDEISLESIKEFKKFKKAVAHTLRKAANGGYVDENFDVYERIRTLKDATQELMNELMTNEMDLVEQFEEALKDFSTSFAEHTAVVIEHAQGVFSTVREMETEYHEKFLELVIACGDKIGKFGGEELDDGIRDVRFHLFF